jgi:cyclase|tara:strand:+ start:217 stop:1050 length:834 start_codon:yes stop_codon:yes gene_type:complete
LLKRIISRLDIKNNHLVKGVNMEGLRILGFPENFAKKYFTENIDELIFNDIVASLYKRNQSIEIVNKITQSIFVPIIIGGGLKNLEDISKCLINGADRVSINTNAVLNPKFLEQAVQKFGASTIVANLEVSNFDNEYKLFLDNGRSVSDKDLFEWVKQIQDIGVGEIIVTSINNDGTFKGFDLRLLEKIKSICSIPLLAHGGAGKNEDVLNLFKKIDLNGCVLSSCLHYYYINKIPKANIPSMGGSEFMKQTNEENLNFQGIKKLKQYLLSNGIQVR